jgi:N-acetylglucosamine kinase-like BadF-type ATPase
VTRRPRILAVDAGGSKVDAALLGSDGRVRGAARVANTDHSGTGGEQHLLVVLDAVAAAAADAGLDPERRPVADLGVYCVAGADFPQDDRRIGRWLHRRDVTSEDIVRNDTFAVLRAGTERPWGVGIVCGYGTNCCGVAPDGRTYRIPAIGEISGDWGGGMDIGRAALWHAMRAEDGRGDRTVLRDLVPARFGYTRPRQLLEAIYFGRADQAQLVHLPPIVFAAAVDGDRIARGIVDRQADEVVNLARATIRRLRLTKLDVDVVLGGGVFRNDDPAFFSRIEGGVHDVAPAARLHVLDAPPLVGAALIALDTIGAPNAAQARTRAALTHERLTDHTREGDRRGTH